MGLRGLPMDLCRLGMGLTQRLPRGFTTRYMPCLRMPSAACITCTPQLRMMIDLLTAIFMLDVHQLWILMGRADGPFLAICTDFIALDEPVCRCVPQLTFWCHLHRCSDATAHVVGTGTREARREDRQMIRDQTIPRPVIGTAIMHAIFVAQRHERACRDFHRLI